MQKTVLINKKSQFQRLKSKLILLLYILIFILFWLYVFRYKIYNYLLDESSIQIEATIINDKNILSKRAINPEFTYSYQFSINGNDYFGDSKNQKYKVGNKIRVEYWSSCPDVNRPKKNK